MQVGAAHECAVALTCDDQRAQVRIVRQRRDRIDEGRDLRMTEAVRAEPGC